MGLLETTELFNRKDVPQEIKEKFQEVKRYTSHLEARLSMLSAENKRLGTAIKEQRRSKQSIEDRLSVNSKSGLLNHLKLNQDMVRILDEVKDKVSTNRFGVLIIKLDHNFDIVNKTLEPSMSEWIIYKIGDRLQGYVDKNGSVYHTRDDEFIIVYNGIKNTLRIESIADEIHKEVRKSHIFSGYHISVGCNIGISLFPEHGLKKRTLLHNADIALGYAREQRSVYQIFTEELRDQVVEKMELQNYIIKALEAQAITEINKQFELFYQPIIRVNQNKSGQTVITDIYGETLIRWNHPTKGAINPDKFIPVAEETGLIIPIGNWVLYTATKQMKQWEKDMGTPIYVSINLSPVQFANANFVSSIERTMQSRKIEPRYIRFEITESCVMEDPAESIKKIEQLRSTGVAFSIDDFGKGYSSLNYLRHFPVNTLKIDKSFVNNICSNQFDQVIVRAIFALAKELNFEVVVEGIETKEQFNYLYAQGCTLFQGYLFSKPKNPADFIEFYQTNKFSEVLG